MSVRVLPPARLYGGVGDPQALVIYWPTMPCFIAGRPHPTGRDMSATSTRQPRPRRHRYFAETSMATKRCSVPVSHGIQINGVDIIRWNDRSDRGLVMVRPLKAINKVWEKMGDAARRRASPVFVELDQAELGESR